MRGSLVFLLYAYTAAVLLIVFLVSPGIVCFSAMLPDMIRGTADRPYVYRMLVPAAVGALADAVPAAWRERLERAPAEHWRIGIAVQRLGWRPELLTEYLIYTALAYGCFLGLAYELRLLAHLFLRLPEAALELVPVLGLLVLPSFFRYCSYLYDPATLLLFTGALVTISSGRLRPYYPIFALATLNKETSCLLIGVFALQNLRRLGRRDLVLHLSAQVLIWAVLKALVTVLHRSAPGSFVEVHLVDHTLRLLQMPGRLAGFLLFAGVWGLLVARGWRKKPIFLRRALPVCLLPLLALSLVFGLVEETRGYYETFPLLFLLAVPTGADLLGSRSARPNSRISGQWA